MHPPSLRITGKPRRTLGSPHWAPPLSLDDSRRAERDKSWDCCCSSEQGIDYRTDLPRTDMFARSTTKTTSNVVLQTLD
eukprot:9484022-Pyramimonas_sp.AAC.1